MKSGWAEPIGGILVKSPLGLLTHNFELDFLKVYENLVQVIIMKCCSLPF